MNPLQKLLGAVFAVVSVLFPMSALANAGGGWTGGGLIGNYYNNKTCTAPAAFTRTDVRLDFPSNGLPPGGSTDSAFATIRNQNWSAQWTGQLIPRYTEQYTFRCYADDSITLTITDTTTNIATTVINQPTYTGAWGIATYSFTAGRLYNVTVNFIQGANTWALQLHWLSTGAQPFPEEAIEPVTPVGGNLNQSYHDPGFTNGALGAAYLAYFSTGGVAAPAGPALAADSTTNGSLWPTADFVLVGTGDSVPSGTQIFSKITFSGKAEVYSNGSATTGGVGGPDDFFLGYNNGNSIGTMSIAGHTYYNYGNDLPIAGQTYDSATGTGYNPATNTTTMLYSPGGYVNVGFKNTARNNGSGLAGITNLTIMNANTASVGTFPAPSVIYTPQYLQVCQPYTALRFYQWTNSAYAIDPAGYTASTDWANRAHPYFCFSADLTAQDQWPWEYAVMLANETGKDMYINLPGTASNTYITNLANLIKYGSDGVNPYTSTQTNPVYPPLNPNLNVYIEYGNENWGGLNFSYGDIVTAINTAYAANNADYLQYTAAGGNDTSPNVQLWTVCRIEKASALFRAVFGNSAMPSSTNGTPNLDPRIRPLYEWQYGGQWNGQGESSQSLLTAVDTAVGLNANYYLWGGGGGWYSDNSPPTTDTLAQLFAITPASITSNILSDKAVCQMFGLHHVGYEGGFDFGGGVGSAYFTEGADSDSRAIAFEEYTLTQYYQAAGPIGSLPFVFTSIDSTYTTTDGWAVITDPWAQEPWTTNPPKLQGIVNFTNQLPPVGMPGGWSNILIGPATTAGGIATGPDILTGAWTLREANGNNTGFGDTNNGHTADNYDSIGTSVSGSNVTMIAELTSAQVGNHPSYGIVFRVSSDPACPMVSLFGTSGQGFAMDWRTSESAPLVQEQGSSPGILTPSNPPTTPPVWLKLVEASGTFTGYVSTTGASGPWTQVASVTIPGFSTTQFLATLAGDSNGGSWPSSQYLATFANVSVSTGLTDADIGSPGKAGSASFNGTTYTVSGGGADIWGTSDQFNFDSQTATGDQTLITEVTSITNTDMWAKAGVMFRDSSASNAIFVDLLASESNGVVLQYRSTTGGNCGNIGVTTVGTPTATNPVWLKLVKSGTTYTGYYSTNGTTWVLVGSASVTLSNSTYLLGLAVTAHNNSALNTATFTN